MERLKTGFYADADYLLIDVNDDNDMIHPYIGNILKDLIKHGGARGAVVAGTHTTEGREWTVNQQAAVMGNRPILMAMKNLGYNDREIGEILSRVDMSVDAGLLAREHELRSEMGNDFERVDKAVVSVMKGRNKADYNLKDRIKDVLNKNSWDTGEELHGKIRELLQVSSRIEESILGQLTPENAMKLNNMVEEELPERHGITIAHLEENTQINLGSRGNTQAAGEVRMVA